MSKLIIFLSYMCCMFYTVFSDNMIGPGKWTMLKIEKKVGDFDKFEFDIEKRKYNRSHDIFKGALNFHEDLTDGFGARVDVCKYVDGGCRQFQVISDDSFGSIINKYADSNFKEMFTMAGLMNPELPIPKGKYDVKEYMWNWNDMPDEAPYGRYCAHTCVMEAAVEVGCITTEISFDEEDEEE